MEFKNLCTELEFDESLSFSRPLSTTIKVEIKKRDLIASLIIFPHEWEKDEIVTNAVREGLDALRAQYQKHGAT